MRCRILGKDIGRKLWNNHHLSFSLSITASRGLRTSGLFSNATTQGVRQVAQHVKALLENQPVDGSQEPSRFSYKFDVDESRTPRFLSLLTLTAAVGMNFTTLCSYRFTRYCCMTLCHPNLFVYCFFFFVISGLWNDHCRGLIEQARRHG